MDATATTVDEGALFAGDPEKPRQPGLLAQVWRKRGVFALTFVAPSGALVNGAVVDLEQYPVIGRNPGKTVE